LVKGEAYAPTGSEMKVSGTKDIKDAVESKSTILIDGEKAALKAYTIKGNNYFKLRDLGTALGFNVGWDNASQTISITSVPSAAEKPAVKEEKTELTWTEAEEMGMYIEIVSIYSSFGFFIDGVRFAEDSPFRSISTKSVTVCGQKATTDVFTGEYAAEFTEEQGFENFDYYLKYNFPKDIILLNNDSYHPDYGKRNDISIEYQLQTKDGKTYTCKANYNMLCEGNGGLWLE
ncbi:MAG: hypothetical protein IJN89_00170, partial [Anaerotignum sp.]|nr:hypothetical protein [Anaerotignum sp.]